MSRITEEDITALARRAGRACKRRRVEVTTAESCTGGALAVALTRIAGSAKWYDRGVVTYANDAKRELLGVRQRTLKQHGAVSEAVAREMAKGALARSPSDVAISVTGIAGPTGAAPGKPVGTVWICWAARGGPVQARCFLFRGDREGIRRQAVATALQGLIDLLK